jgi:hypothetical protein
MTVKYSNAAFLILTFLLVVTAGCILLDRPPAPVPSSAPPQEFSAERALAYLYDFAQKPHPIGTAEHDRVRDYLLAQITTLGTVPEVQRATGVTPIYQAAGRVENILARLKGTSGSSDAVMLAAHYDSVVAGPGAADDGAGVAALLETLRALRAEPPLKNDVIFLFTDGEEEGMLGAAAFVAEHPWAKDVRVAVNFEARGNAGVSRLFETSAGNGRLVQILAQSAPHTAGSSLDYEIYKHLRNDTDMTMFKKSGTAGLNFAFIGHWQDYHTPLDNPQRLDRGSLQQHGEYALSLAHAMGNADLAQLGAPDANYFAIPGGFFLHYSATRIWPFTILVALVFLGIAFYATGASGLTPRRFFLSLLANLASLAVLMLFAYGFVKVVVQLHSDKLPEGDLVRSVPYVLSLMAFLAALEMTLYKLFRRWLGWHGLFLSASALMLILTLVVTKWLPGGSYALLWPLLAMLLGSLFVVPGKENLSLFATIVACLLALPPLLLFVPLLRGSYDALGFTQTSAPSLALLLGVLILTIMPLLEILLTLSRSLVPFLTLCVALLLFVLGASVTRYDAAHPKPSIVTYALDSDTGKALWATTADRLDSWTVQYVGESPARAKLKGFYPSWLPFQFLQHEAPALSLASPRVDVLENSVTADTRTLRLHITSPRRARALTIEAPDNEILDAWVDDRKLGLPAESRWNKNGKWGFDYANVPAEGIEVKLQARGAGPVRLVVVDRSIGLPEIPGATFAPRPADSMPQRSGDVTMVLHSFVF